MTVACYAAVGKSKAPAICGAFAIGAGGGLVVPDSYRDVLNGSVLCFGSSSANLERVDRMQQMGADWYYGDGAYGFGRGTHFRVTRRGMQVGLSGREDSARFNVFGIDVKQYRRDGATIVIATQSDLWHRWATGRSAKGWAESVAAELARVTDRRVVICAHKGEYPFAEALRSAFAVVTHSSSAAVAAAIEGVPSFCLEPGAATAFAAFSSSDLSKIETPFYPDPEIRARALWRMAAAQWTREEIADGTAWKVLTQ